VFDTIYDSRNVPASDRLGELSEAVSRNHPAVLPAAAGGAEYHALLSEAVLGPVVLLTAATTPVTLVRSARLVRREDPGQYQLTLLLRGERHTALTGGQEISEGAGSLRLCLSSAVTRTRLVADDRPVRLVNVSMPYDALPVPQRLAHRAAARPLDSRQGVGALVHGALRQFVAAPHAFRTPDRPHLGTVLVDLVTALLVREIEEEHAAPPETHRRVLLLRAKAFIRRHLHDPDLDPQTVAAALHISVGHLHRLFRADGTTVGRWTRARRLENARRELADPAMRHVPVHRIASRWGFSHHAAFTRAFREAYGLSPRDARDPGREQ
jgi:AraC-like DNA-binding protein